MQDIKNLNNYKPKSNEYEKGLPTGWCCCECGYKFGPGEINTFSGDDKPLYCPTCKKLVNFYWQN